MHAADKPARRVTRENPALPGKSATHPKPVERVLTSFRNKRPMRVKSLIITLFGDVVSQHGHTIWLGSVVRTLAKLGINERLVRTSVFRLAQENWLQAERVGRRSYYRFTAHGSAEYQRAARRIYAIEDTLWDGHWQLLVPVDIADEDRENFRRSLAWQGFRAISTGTFARPGKPGRTLQETLEEFHASDGVLLFDATSSQLASHQSLRATVKECWQLDNTAAAYRSFLEVYQPVHQWLARQSRLAPETAFILRTLLVHDYRRVLLHDTPLPEELLPPGWPGASALAITADMYRRLAEDSIAHITTYLEGGNGPLPPANPGFYERFPPPG